ncbi:MAG TPA: ATP synthase F1 subunit delta [Bacillota bacterium]|nr:ATP synthase F1 subunit delta [Bacillota bacterium]
MHSQAAHKFAQALVELAGEKGILEPVRQAALELMEGLQSPEMQLFLKHPRPAGKDKKAVLQQALGDKVPPEFRNFINIIIDRRRESLLPSIMEAVIELTLEAQGYLIVELISARPLTEVEQTGVNQNLERIWQTRVHLKYRENPALIGGVMIRRGDQLIDGSLAGQLKSIKQLLIEETTLSFGF